MNSYFSIHSPIFHNLNIKQPQSILKSNLLRSVISLNSFLGLIILRKYLVRLRGNYER